MTLITQAMADYLSDDPALNLDGIMYRSARGDDAGSNVALFNKASRTAVLEFPVGTKLSSHLSMDTEDGPEPDFAVWEEVITPKKKRPRGKAGGPLFQPSFADPPVDLDDIIFDDREVTLRVDPASLVVPQITRAAYEVDSHTVSRHRFNLRDLKF